MEKKISENKCFSLQTTRNWPFRKWVHRAYFFFRIEKEITFKKQKRKSKAGLWTSSICFMKKIAELTVMKWKYFSGHRKSINLEVFVYTRNNRRDYSFPSQHPEFSCFHCDNWMCYVNIYQWMQSGIFQDVSSAYASKGLELLRMGNEKPSLNADTPKLF